MKMIESRGKTLDEAIQNGLDQLGISREDADITVLDEASKGFLGLGAKPARVLITEKLMRVSREEDRKRQAREQRENEEKARIQKEQRDREAAAKAEKIRKEKEAEKAERENQQAAEKAEKAEKTAKAAQKAAEKVIEKPAAPQQIQVATPVDVKRGVDSQPPRQRQERASQERKPASRQAEPRPQRASRPTAARDIKKETPAKPGEETALSNEAKVFLEELLKQMGVDDVEITATEGSNGISMSAAGASAGALIGYRGETLDALQYLVSLKINKGEEDYHRISLDAEGYRAKREDILIKLAHRLANKAVKTGRKVSLEPMNPYERRILHSALQGHAAVRTHSEGTDPYRRVVITPKSAQRKPPVAAAKPRVQARAAAETTEQS